MPAKRPVLWLAVLGALLVVGPGFGWLLAAQGLPRAGAALAAISTTGAALWLVGGLFAFAQPRWLLWTLLYLGLVALGAVLALSFFRIAAPAAGLLMLGAAALGRTVLLARAYDTRPTRRTAATTLLALLEVLALCWCCQRAGFGGTAIALAGISAMSAAFLLALWLVRAGLSPGHPITAVARTLVDEAMRMKIVLVLIVLVLLVVPILPYAGGPDSSGRPTELLKYRIGAFLAWSLWATAILLSLMSVFLACWTVSGDIRNRQVFLTMTKPVGRGQYLLGKWLGVCLLDLLLVAVAGGGIYIFARVMEQRPEARDAYDRQAIGEQVLVARVTVLPQLPGGVTLAELVRRRRESAGVSSQAIADQRPQSAEEELKQERSRWHTVAYLGTQTFVFEGLAEARETARTVQLRLKPQAQKEPDSGVIQFAMRINGRPYELPSLALDQVHVLPISTSFIDDAGRLEIQVINQHPWDKEATFRTDLSFTPGDGFQLLYRHGGFGPNLVRGLAMIWVQQCFLAMVGVAAGTFLGFPVACLVALLVYVTALLSSFLAESLSYYAGVNSGGEALWDRIVAYPVALWTKLAEGSPWEATKVVIRMVGEAFVALVPSFSRYNPIPLLADGQLVRPGMVGRALLMVGGVWTGLTAVAAYAVFRRRELARVVV